MTSQTSSTAGNILAIDTSGSRGSLCLNHARVDWDKKAVHSELATVKLSELLDQAGLTLKELRKITVNVGPGSFTGIRVGVNLARTLAYSLSLPICAFNSLELLTFRHARQAKSSFVAIKAIQNFYYSAAYEITPLGLVERLAPRSLTESELEKEAGDYQEILIEGQTPGFSSDLDAQIQIDWLAQWPDSTNFLSWKEVRPVYIRASEAEEKLLKGLLKL